MNRTPTVAIIGASRGIGLELARQYATAGWRVHDSTRTPQSPGALGTIAVLIRQEFLLAVVGGVFVIETLSVILQVAYFKMTGKRIFLMAPIHHHYEQLGWPEQKIVVRFWIISIILGLVALSSLKLR